MGRSSRGKFIAACGVAVIGDSGSCPCHLSTPTSGRTERMHTDAMLGTSLKPLSSMRSHWPL